MAKSERRRKHGEEVIRGQPPSQSRSKKESKTYRTEKDKSPEVKGCWDNLRLKKKLARNQPRLGIHS